MTMMELRQMRNRAPFRPLDVHLTTGEVLAVQHPDNMSIPAPDDGKEADLFVVWTHHRWNLVEAGQVARLSVEVDFPN